jgi:PEGA domain
MKKIVLSLAVLPLLAGAAWGAPQPPQEQAAAGQIQKFVVRSSNHFVAPVETLTNAEANCSIDTAPGAASMSCRPLPVTQKNIFHYNVALIVDGKGMGYVVACRLSLIAIWCKQYSAGKVLSATMDSVKVTIDGDKGHDYVVLTSAFVGLPALSPLPAPAAVAAATSPKAAPAPVQAAPAPTPTANKAASNSEKASGNSSAACVSTTGACVSFVSDPQGADIYVDGKFVGNTPSMLALSVGSHEIRVESANRKPWTRTLETSAGSNVTIRATLDALAPGK